MADRADLIRETAGELFGLATGQPVKPADAARIEELIDPTLEFLADTDVIYIASADDIRGSHLKPLARFLADECRPKFLMPSDPVARARALDDLSLLQRINGEAMTPEMRVDSALTRRRRY